MERAGAGLAELVVGRVPARPRRRRLRQGQQRRRRARRGAAAARARPRGRRAAAGARRGAQGRRRTNFERLPGRAAGAVRRRARCAGAAAIVDAILGTGFAGEPREPAEGGDRGDQRGAARAGRRSIACDVPSGVDASTGEVAGAAVRADATGTFHAAKPGLWIAPGKDHAGEVTWSTSGSRPARPVDPAVGLIDAAVVDGVPRRGRESTKFAAGRGARLRRLARADRRAVPGLRGGAARRRRLRHRAASRRR